MNGEGRDNHIVHDVFAIEKTLRRRGHDVVSTIMRRMQHEDVQLPCQERPVQSRGYVGRTTQDPNLHHQVRISARSSARMLSTTDFTIARSVPTVRRMMVILHF